MNRRLWNDTLAGRLDNPSREGRARSRAWFREFNEEPPPPPPAGRPSDLPPPDRYPHGTRARYVAAKCRCDACREANRRYYHERVAARAAGDTAELVPADRARSHIHYLAKHGVGFRTVADVSGVGITVVANLKSGKQTQLRASTERAILAVTPEAGINDQTMVDAGPTWAKINHLLEEGYTKHRIARELGYTGQGLQFRRDFISMKNAAKVDRLYREATDPTFVRLKVR